VAQEQLYMFWNFIAFRINTSSLTLAYGFGKLLDSVKTYL